MATEANLTYLGRLFITQYVFKLDIILQLLCCTLRRHCHCCCSGNSDCLTTDLRIVGTPVDSSV